MEKDSDIDKNAKYEWHSILFFLTSGGDLDDFDDVAFGEGGGGDFPGEEGDLVVLDDDGFAGEAEAFEQVGDGGDGVEGAGLAVDGEGHFGWVEGRS